MYKCKDLYYDYSFNNDTCNVNVYTDENGLNCIQSFSLHGQYKEQEFKNIAYKTIYDFRFNVIKKIIRTPIIQLCDDNKPLYVSKYFNNGRKITFHITNNEEDAHTSIQTNDGFSTINFTKQISKLMTVRDIICTKEFEYLNVSDIKMRECRTYASMLLTDDVILRNIPQANKNYNGINPNTTIKIYDDVNNKIINFKYKPLLSEQQSCSKYAGNYILNFGNYMGNTIQEIDEIDPDYLNWIVSNKDFNDKEVVANIIVYRSIKMYNIENPVNLEDVIRNMQIRLTENM